MNTSEQHDALDTRNNSKRTQTRKGLLCNQDVLAMRTDFRSGELESAGRAVAYVGTEALGE